MPAARQTMYRGIQMRSRLESRFAANLDRMGFAWEYEPGAFADGTGEYLPDFLIDLGEKPLYVEVKGPIQAGDQWTLALDRLWIIRSSHPTAALALIVDEELAGPADYRMRHFGWSLWWSGDGIRIASFAICPTCARPTISWSNHVHCHRCGSRQPVQAYLNPLARMGVA